MDLPLISIIAPVYNVEKYVGRCIESIISQTYKNWEMILVDDCGQDDSMSVVKRYVSKDSRIRCIEGEKNYGPMIAREKGYTAAKGEFITFLDSDDTLPANTLESFYNEVQKNDADIVIGDFQKIFEDGSRETMLLDRTILGEHTKKEVFELLLQSRLRHCVWGGLYRAKLFQCERIDNFEGLKNGEDGILFYQLVERANKIVIFDTVVYNYWIHSTSSSHKEMNDSIVKSMALFELYKYRILKKSLGEVDEEYLRNVYRPVVSYSRKYPYKRIMKIYREVGLFNGWTDIDLLRLYKPTQAIKYYIITRFLSHKS